MEWVKLVTDFHEDGDLAAAGEAAEVLFTRALSYCGAQETEGFISDGIVTRLAPTRTKARTDALVRHRLWIRDDERGGWIIRSWSRIQDEHDALAARRRADRERQQRHRQRSDEDGHAPPPTDPLSRDNGRSSRDDSRDDSRDRLRDNGRDVTRDSRDRARANSRGTSEVDPGNHQGDYLASCDAPARGDEHHSTAGEIAALYAAGVPLSDHGRALRTIAAALDAHYAPDLVRRGVGALIAEQRACTRDTLRIAMTAGQDPTRRAEPTTASEKAAGWLAVGRDDQHPQLRALPGGAS
jgi:hypothetical protein